VVVNGIVRGPEKEMDWALGTVVTMVEVEVAGRYRPLPDCDAERTIVPTPVKVRVVFVRSAGPDRREREVVSPEEAFVRFPYRS
jgi:hypothetical protein